jgi:methionyl-tRNA formyltransferase
MGAEIDLLLGGDLGQWVLSWVAQEHVRRVVTVDPELAHLAESSGFEAELGHIDRLAASPAEVAFSVHYPRLLSRDTIGRYRQTLNLHPGLLPFGRGWYPAFWALWEGTPAGATLHHMTAGADEGPIVDQIEVAYDAGDTGGSLHTRVREAERALFERYWPRIASGDNLESRAQEAGGTSHSREEFDELKRAAPWRDWDAERLVRLARCLSFPGYSGAEITSGDRVFSLELRELEPARARGPRVGP